MLAMIVAVADNGVIGKDNQLIWNIALLDMSSSWGGRH